MVFLDNAGIMLAGIFRAPSTGTKTVFGLLNTGGASFGTKMYSDQGQNLFNLAPLKTVQIGKGNTPVTRQDFKLETVFPDSPESSSFASLNGGYNSGLGKIEIPATLSNTGGAGTISEIVKFSRVHKQDNSGLQTIILFRDLVSDVGFIIGESINVNYEVLI